jgi:hypothetical protein
MLVMGIVPDKVNKKAALRARPVRGTNAGSAGHRIRARGDQRRRASKGSWVICQVMGAFMG